LTLLKAQKLNNKLPKELPKNTVIAHKTGELDMVSHDAGIVYAQNGNYIIVVMSETSLPVAANERIADISKGVYEYFISKK
jgi:beta-lactamase class A